MKSEHFGQVYINQETGKKRIKMFDQEGLDNALSKYDEGDRVILKIETFYRKRSKSQNAVMHVYFGKIAEHTGHGSDEIKEMMKYKFLRVPMTDALGNEVVDSDTGELEMVTRKTSHLTTVEAVEFCDQIREWANTVLGLDLPEPDKNWKLNL